MIAGGGVCNRCNVKGFRFQPTDEELLYDHLIPKILDPDSGQHYIGDIKDLSQFEPSELFRETQKNPDDKEGYFFWSPTYKDKRIIRQGKSGSWGETRRWASIDSGEESVIAKKRVFVFHEGCSAGPRTAWFIYQFGLAVSHPDPIHQDKKEIFLCKLAEHKRKDRLSGSKRKAEHNVQETSTTRRRARKDNNLRKKAKVSSAQEAQLGDEHNNNNIMNCEVVMHASQSLPPDHDLSILSGELTTASHHLPSKDFGDNNMLAGGHYWSTGGLHPSNGFPGDDNQQCHHLSSNSTNSISTCIGMQPRHHVPSSTPEENSKNENPQYNEKRKEGSQLRYNMPLDLDDDVVSSELLQRSHHLPSDCQETIASFDAHEECQSKLPPLEGCSLDHMDEDANHYLNIEELEAQLGQPQPPTTLEVRSCNDLPPSSDLSRGADKFHEQCCNSEADNASFWASLLDLLDSDTRPIGLS